ncbi:hypothetical protein G6L37_34890 [Agrobacterium rubi]|nr:hypothetical protein [Agrobacterium rubi]NTF23756.1 hypothetical protein [Agrobacterium rubi]
MTETNPAQISALAGFVSRNRQRLVATTIGGIALACIANPILAETTIKPTSAAHELTVINKLAMVLKNRPPEQTFLGSAASVINPGELDEIREALDDKRARLESAMRELENLELMVEVAEALDPSERDEAVAAALLIYNESVAQAGFDVDVELDNERVKTNFEKAESSTGLLLSLNPMQ